MEQGICSDAPGNVSKISVKHMGDVSSPKRKRSMTSIALGWLTERMRRTEEVKQAVQSGSYKIPAEKVAKALVQPDEENPQPGAM